MGIKYTSAQLANIIHSELEGAGRETVTPTIDWLVTKLYHTGCKHSQVVTSVRQLVELDEATYDDDSGRVCICLGTNADCFCATL